jgi:hypothetical protein
VERYLTLRRTIARLTSEARGGKSCVLKITGADVLESVWEYTEGVIRELRGKNPEYDKFTKDEVRMSDHTEKEASSSEKRAFYSSVLQYVRARRGEASAAERSERGRAKRARPSEASAAERGERSEASRKTVLSGRRPSAAEAGCWRGLSGGDPPNPPCCRRSRTCARSHMRSVAHALGCTCARSHMRSVAHALGCTAPPQLTIPSFVFAARCSQVRGQL